MRAQRCKVCTHLDKTIGCSHLAESVPFGWKGLARYDPLKKQVNDGCI